jgi:hypothetical protein
MRSLVIAFGAILAGIGIVGIVAPSVLLDLARSLDTATGLYVVAAVRIGFGVILLSIGGRSRLPTALRVIGAVLVVAGIATPFFGVERTRAIVEWWSAQGSTFMRGLACVAVAFGLFFIYAVTPRRGARI